MRARVHDACVNGLDWDQRARRREGDRKSRVRFRSSSELPQRLPLMRIPPQTIKTLTKTIRLFQREREKSAEEFEGESAKTKINTLKLDTKLRSIAWDSFRSKPNKQQKKRSSSAYEMLTSVCVWVGLNGISMKYCRNGQWSPRQKTADPTANRNLLKSFTTKNELKRMQMVWMNWIRREVWESHVHSSQRYQFYHGSKFQSVDVDDDVMWAALHISNNDERATRKMWNRNKVIKNA